MEAVQKTVARLDPVLLQRASLALVVEPLEEGGFAAYVLRAAPLEDVESGAMLVWPRDEALMTGQEPFQFRFNTTVCEPESVLLSPAVQDGAQAAGDMDAATLAMQDFASARAGIVPVSLAGGSDDSDDDMPDL